MSKILYQESKNTIILSPYRDEYFTDRFTIPPGTYMRNYSTEKKYKIIENLKKSLSKKNKQLKLLDIDPLKCRHVVLSNAQEWPMEYVEKNFKSFKKSLRDHFPKMCFIKKYEYNEMSSLLHLHVILIFDGDVPEFINADFISSYWKYGNVSCTKVFDLYGLLDYFCKVQKEKVLLDYGSNSSLTKYPYGCKVLTWSPNIPKKELKTEILDKQDVDVKLSEFIDKHDGQIPKAKSISSSYLDANDNIQQFWVRDYYWYD